MGTNGDHTFKCVLLGDGATGKTTFMRAYLTGEFTQHYEPTIGVEIHSVKFYGCDGRQYEFQVWDTAGQQGNGGLQDGYYLQADCAILMFDLTSPSSAFNLPKWHRSLVRVCSHIPMVLCGNKSDRGVTRRCESIRIQRRLSLRFYPVSSKYCYNFEKIFLSLARQLVGDPSLYFCDEQLEDDAETQPAAAEQSNGEGRQRNAEIPPPVQLQQTDEIPPPVEGQPAPEIPPPVEGQPPVADPIPVVPPREQ